MHSTTAKRVLTTGEIAKYCGVHFRTVLRWIKRGQLPAFQLPGRGDNRVEVDDFLNFLREHNLPIPEEFIEQKRRVLIVEDEAPVARSIRRALDKAGYETHVATDAFEAGSLLRDLVPAVITLDLRMPGASGMKVIEHIRGDDRLTETRILVVSGLSAKELDKALKAGADDVLAKPFKGKELLEKVDALISTIGRPKPRPRASV